MGVVGQFNTVDFDFTVFEMVMMGRTPHKSLLGSDKAVDYEISLDVPFESRVWKRYES